MSSILAVSGLCKKFGGVTALDEFTCSGDQGEIVGLVGPNGAGKTTFFNVLSGLVLPGSGCAAVNGNSVIGLQPYQIAKIGVARSFQEVRLLRDLSVRENILLSFPNQPGEQLANLFVRRREWRTREVENWSVAEAILESVGLMDQAAIQVEELSYGQQKLLSLACCIATDATLVLLDEPVAGIAPEMIQKALAVVRGLAKEGKSVVVIDHNVDAMRDICDRIVFMDAGRNVCEGKPSDVLADPRVIEAYLC